MKSIAVFCASSRGNNEVYYQSAYEVGEFLASENIHVVYGGSRMGLMGAVADGALSKGGRVTGVLPDFMTSRELEHTGITEMIKVKSMHERKLKMHELSEGVLALPGGFGTFEELFEMLTWGQLGIHRKPVGLLNVSGYYNHLIAMFKHMVGEGLLRRKNLEMVLSSNSIHDLLRLMETYKPPRPAINLKESQT